MRQIPRHFVSIVLLATFASSAASVNAASPNEVGKHVTAILDQGWKLSPEADAVARQHFDAAQLVAPNDARVPYAMALVAMHSHRSTDAVTYLRIALNAADKTALPIQCDQIWQEALAENQSAVVGDTMALIKQLSESDNRAVEADRLATARWLGKFIAFFHGPGKGKLGEADSASIEAQMNQFLRKPLLAEVEEGKMEAAKQLDDLRNQLRFARTEAINRNDAKRVADRKKNFAALATSRAKTQQAEKARDEFLKRSAEDQKTIQQEIEARKQQLSDAAESRQSLMTPPENTSGNPDDVNTVDLSVNRQLHALQVRERALQQRLSELRNAVAALQRQEKSLRDQADRQNAIQATLEQKNQDLAAKVGNDDGSTAAIEAKIASISTYLGADLEQEKKLLLESYGVQTVNGKK